MKPRPSDPSCDTAFQTELVALIPHLRAFARSLTGDASAADDLAQDAMMKAWNARGSYEMGTNMKAWAFLILRNQFYSDKRRSWRQSQLDQDTAERTLLAVDDPSAPIALDELRMAMAMLPAEQREALVLVGAGGFSYDEAAVICGCPEGTVKKSGQSGPQCLGEDPGRRGVSSRRRPRRRRHGSHLSPNHPAEQSVLVKGTARFNRDTGRER